MASSQRPSAADVGQVVGQLREHFGDAALEIVEYWDEDCCAVGISRPGGRARLAYISTCAKPPGRYAVTLEDASADGTGPCVSCGRHDDVAFERLVELVGEHFGLGPAGEDASAS